MNKLFREYERSSGLEIYGLGAKRDRWEHTIEKFAELIVDECCLKLLDMDEKTKGNHNYYKHAALEIKKHFGEEKNGSWKQI